MTHLLPALLCAAALVWGVAMLIAAGLDRLARCQATWLEDEPATVLNFPKDAR